jgi:hypothetical protein
MFNNGTVHVNLTLPTRLDASGGIADMEDFRRRHQRAARYFQWFEPLLAVAYGAADPFASYVDEGSRFSPVSQRLAVSRYVGMCNYPTAAMPEGKILTYDVSRGVGYSSPGVATSHVGFDSEPAWYEEFYKRTAYVRLENHGLDINYKKHWNHGLEFRIFDGLRRDQMLEVCKFVWKVCYRSLDLSQVEDCRRADWYQELVLGCMLEGADYVLSWGMLVRYLEAIHYRELLVEFAGAEKEGVPVGELVGKIINGY